MAQTQSEHGLFNEYNANGKAEALVEQQEQAWNLAGLTFWTRFTMAAIVVVSLLLAWIFSGAIARYLGVPDFLAALLLAFAHLGLAISVHFAFETRGHWVPLAGAFLSVVCLWFTLLWRVQVMVREDGSPESLAWAFGVVIFLIECLVPATLAGLHAWLEARREDAACEVNFYRLFARNVVKDTAPLDTWSNEMDTLRRNITVDEANRGLHTSRALERLALEARVARDSRRLQVLENWYPGPRVAPGPTNVAPLNGRVGHAPGSAVV